MAQCLSSSFKYRRLWVQSSISDSLSDAFFTGVTAKQRTVISSPGTDERLRPQFKILMLHISKDACLERSLSANTLQKQHLKHALFPFVNDHA